jgi:2-keto-4-pentenoate hydratase
MDERIESGMRIQLAGWRSAMGLADVERVGWKVGLNAPPVMEALEIDRPVIGWLGSGTTLAAPAEFVTAGATKIGAEPELAITVGEGGNVAGLAPAIEIVDVDKSFDDLAAILADNIFHRGVVFGPQSEPRALPGITARIACDGEPEAELELADAVGDPAEVVALVAGRLEEMGEVLEPGDRIIAGALTPILFAERVSAVALDMGPLGAVALRFR